MNVSIQTLEGSTDGLRWGLGARSGKRRRVRRFRWTYDMLGDRLRLWSFVRVNSKAEEVCDPEAAAAARLIVREWLGMGV